MSYSLEDSHTARQVVQAIEQKGWPISWERFAEPNAITTLALREDCVIVLWSRDSIRSAEVLDEARYGRSSGILVQAAIDDAPIPMPFLLDEPTALTDEWSVTSLVRNVGRVLREGSGAPDPEPDEEKDLATAQEEFPRENLEQAEVHAEAGKLDQAIAIYERWVELKPDDMKVVRRLADMYLSADRRAEAASRYAEVAEHYARSGFSDLSLDTYQRVVELVPDKSEYGVRLEQLQTLRQNERDRPRGAMSGVMFSIAAPLYVAAGDSFSLDVWAHAEKDLAKVVDGVATRAAESAPPSSGSAVQARLHIDGLEVACPDQSLSWLDGMGRSRFGVTTKPDAASGGRAGVVSIHSSGLQLARVRFLVQIGAVTQALEIIPSRQERHHRAFACFAPEDRARVHEQMKAFEKISPGVEVFLEAPALRAQRDGLSRFLEMVSSVDVFYLFWSRESAASNQVKREWRYALRLRGIDFIDAILLDSPEVAPPPELATLHDGDWRAAYDGVARPQARPAVEPTP